MKELTLQEAALAWAQGKRVEATGGSGRGEFCSISKPGESCGRWSPAVFGVSDGDNHKFRLAPEPPAKRYRPWTPEEVPVGAVTRAKFGGDVLMIIGRRENGALLAGDNGEYPLSALLDAREHSTDGGKTWLPCGVEVEA